MKNLKILQSICLSDKNIDIILNIIRNDVKLSTNLATKCIEVIRKIMTRNIGKINRVPSTKSEMKVVIKHLNKLCVGEIVELLARKYPERCVRKKSSKLRLEEDLDIYGNQGVHINDRPKHTGRKSTKFSEDSDENRTDLSGYDSTGGFASAFGDHLIIDSKMRQMVNQFPSNNKDDNESIEKRYQQMLNERKLENKKEKPETPDFSLDGSGEKAKKERMMRKMEESNTGNMQSIQSMMDDPYASLLGSGAPMNFGSIDSMYGMNQMQYSNMNSSIQNNYDQELQLRNLQGNNMNLPINSMMSMNYMQ